MTYKVSVVSMGACPLVLSCTPSTWKAEAGVWMPAWMMARETATQKEVVVVVVVAGEIGVKYLLHR